jgi:hypothetical protein
MCVTRVATMRCAVARPWELSAPHIVHPVTSYGVVRNVLAVSLRGLLTV